MATRALALAAAVLASGAEAHAQAWTVTAVSVPSGGPTGSALRAWGPTNEVFLAAETSDLGVLLHEVHLFHIMCTDSDPAVPGNDCLGAPVIPAATYISDIEGLNHPQVSLGVRRLSSASPREVTLATRFHLGTVANDCDGDTIVSPDEEKNADLLASLWDSSTGTVVDDALIANDGGTACENHGISVSRFGQGDQWACYSHDPDGKTGPADEEVACNHETPFAAGVVWSNEVVMDNAGTDGVDHPAFDFFGPTDGLAVSATARTGTEGGAALVHFPDVALEPTVDFARKFGGKVDHTDVVSGGGKLRMVWRDGVNLNADLRYAECDGSAYVDCIDQADWTDDLDLDTIPDTIGDPGEFPSAENPELAVDGDKQFVSFFYDSGDVAERYTVMVAERCGTGAWTFAQVRVPPNPEFDQTTMNGRPSIGLDRNKNIVHVTFVEVANYQGGEDMDDNGTLFWARRAYTDCAP